MTRPPPRDLEQTSTPPALAARPALWDEVTHASRTATPAMHVTDSEDGLGRARIGRYTVLRKLGSGGMGVVYAAFDDSLDRKVAIKVLRETSDDPQDQARLLREAQALARLSHPNVVTVHDVGTTD
ncbi:MAG TPA: protein kinase, partial [Nannocystis sp.]